MEFLLAEAANEEADQIRRAEREPASGSDPTRAAKQQACRAYYIAEIARFLERNCRLSRDARQGIAFRMERALTIAGPHGGLSTGDITTLVKGIAGD